MNPILLLLLLGGGIGTAVAIQASKPAIAGPPPGQRDPLVPMHWYRVACTLTQAGSDQIRAALALIPGAQVTPATQARVAVAGITELLAAQGFIVKAIALDGTGSNAVGYYVGGQGAFASTAMVTVSAWQDIPVPSAAQQAAMIAPAFDPAMPVATSDAVSLALVHETDPAKLNAFAESLLPDYPAASALLKTKAGLLSTLQSLPMASQAAVAAGCGCGSDVATGGFFEDVGHALSGVANDANKAVSSVTNAVSNTINQIPGVAQVAKAAADAAGMFTGATLLSMVVQGKSLSDIAASYASTVKEMAPLVESVVSIVPGIGPEASSAIAFGCSLAEGKNIDQASLDAAVALVPGGPLVQDSIKAAAKTTIDLLGGKNLGQAAADAIGQFRNAVPGGDAGKAAFDAALAVAQGKKLQDVGYAAVKDLLPGAGAAQAAAFCKKMLDNPKNVVGAVEDGLAGELTQLGGGAFESVHKLVSQIVSTPTLGSLTVGELAQKFGVADAVARAAKGCVKLPKSLLSPALLATVPGLAGPAATVLKGLVVVDNARLQKFGTPPPRTTAKAVVKMALRMGAPSAAAAAKKLAASAHPADLKTKARANDLAQAARLVSRSGFVTHYLAMRPKTASVAAAAQKVA